MSRARVREVPTASFRVGLKPGMRDVAPTLAQWLGVSLPAADGKALLL